MEDELIKLFPIGSHGVLDLSPKERSWLTRKASKDEINFELLARFLASSEGQQVVELNLQGSSISDQSLQLLAPVVARSHHLRKLNLKNNDVKITTMYVFISLLMEINTTLVELQIDDVKEKSALLPTPTVTVATDLDDKTMRQQINPLVNVFNAFNSALHRCVTQQLPDLRLNFKQTIEKPKRGSKAQSDKASSTLSSSSEMQRRLNTIERTLPPQVFSSVLEKLTHLVALTIDGWPSEIPTMLYNLTSLQALSFVDVPVDAVSPDVALLTNLHSLSLSSCRLPQVDARLFTPMTALTELNMPNNFLKAMPQHFELLLALQQLDLRNNFITTIPSSIDKLANLKRLYLHNNEITHLPLSIANLDNLEDFTGALQRGETPRGIDESIAVSERASIDANQPFTLLYSWLKGLSEGSMTVNRCKLMLVGDGNVGKTSTVRSLGKYSRGEGTLVKKTTTSKLKLKLLEKRSSDTSNDDFANVATDGIDIHNVVIKTDEVRNDSNPNNPEGSEGITFSCWDFAGQEAYYNTHQFFLTGRSIYCVCFRLDQTLELSLPRLDYWMQSIATRSPGAPVCILGTRADVVSSSDEALAALKKKLKALYKKNSLIEVFFISNQTLRGVSEFAEGLVQICIDQSWKSYLGIDEIRPVSYLAIEEAAKEASKQRDHPSMPWDEWVQFVHTKGNIKEEGGVIAATQFLHDTGSIVWFAERDFRDTIVLDPRWLPDVFASIISVKASHVNRGILAYSDLPQVWKRYPASLHSFMLELLLKFELISPLPSNWKPSAHLIRTSKIQSKDSSESQALSVCVNTDQPPKFWLVPALLPDSEPSLDELEECWPAAPQPIQISRIYTFNFLPIGFFPRLVARVLSSKWSLQLVWKNGVVAQGEMAQMLLKHDEAERQIYMSLRGPRNTSQLATVIESLNTLISDWLKDVKISVTIPIHLPSGRTHILDMSLVEKFVSKGGLFVTVMNEKIRLDGVVPELVFAGVFEERSISETEIEIQQEIGRGAYAIVYKGVYKSGDVAVKRLQMEQGLNSKKNFSSLYAEFRREVYLMSRLQHENIVKLLGVQLHPTLSMVMELMELGPLHKYLYKYGRRDVSWDEKHSIAVDIAKGMSIIHSTNPPLIHRGPYLKPIGANHMPGPPRLLPILAHRPSQTIPPAPTDLKSPNILLTQSSDKPFPTAKIADFGLSRGLEFSKEYFGSVVDNPTWLAPEVIKRQSYNQSVDVYAFGVILYEIAMQQAYFSDTSFLFEVEEKVCRGERPEISPEVPHYFKDLIQACWAGDPLKRPTFNQAVSVLEAKSIAPLRLISSPELKRARSRGIVSPLRQSRLPDATQQPTSASPPPSTSTSSDPTLASIAAGGEVPTSHGAVLGRRRTRRHSPAVTAHSPAMYIPMTAVTSKTVTQTPIPSSTEPPPEESTPK